MTIALAIFTSPRWKRGLPVVEERLPGMSLRALCAAMTGAVYFQLVLGALMRHTKSGLAIPDFPLAFGGIIPEFTSEKVAIHFAHRIGAVIVTAAIVWTFWRVRRFYRDEPLLARPAAVLLCLVLAQFTLGAFTVWSAKHFLITTAHVATGALVLGVSFLLTVRAFTMVRRGTAPTTYPAREAAWR
jgi:cytochrome c oxidase assembly protein subunit 15